MRIIRCIFSTVALLAAFGISSAMATLTKEQIVALRFDGLYLGMTPEQVDAYIHARKDLGEARVNEPGWYDCGYLASKEDWPVWEARQRPGVVQPGFPRWMGFSDASSHNYGLRFDFEPTHAFVSRVDYTERRGIGGWSTWLAEAEARFGKADLVGPRKYGEMRAVWCTPGSQCRLDDHESDEPQLSLTYYPHTRTSAEPGDRLNYTVNEGRARYDERRAIYRKLPTADPSRSRKLFDRCVGPKGKFATEQEAERHYITLASFGRNASKPIWDTSAVPEPVFRALGVDPAKTFGSGICFWPFDVFLNEDIPGCTSFTATQFRWARRVGDVWLVALRFGGLSTRDSYAAVRRAGNGPYQKIWWSNDMASFSAWHTNGAIPMIEKKAN